MPPHAIYRPRADVVITYIFDDVRLMPKARMKSII